MENQMVTAGPDPSTVVQIGDVCDYITPKQVARLPEWVGVEIVRTGLYRDTNTGQDELRIHLRSLDGKWKTSICRHTDDWVQLFQMIGITVNLHGAVWGQRLWASLAMNNGLVDIIRVAPYEREADRHVSGN